MAFDAGKGVTVTNGGRENGDGRGGSIPAIEWCVLATCKNAFWRDQCWWLIVPLIYCSIWKPKPCLILLTVCPCHILSMSWLRNLCMHCPIHANLGLCYITRRHHSEQWTCVLQICGYATTCQLSADCCHADAVHTLVQAFLRIFITPCRWLAAQNLRLDCVGILCCITSTAKIGLLPCTWSFHLGQQDKGTQRKVLCSCAHMACHMIFFADMMCIAFLLDKRHFAADWKIELSLFVALLIIWQKASDVCSIFCTE